MQYSAQKLAQALYHIASEGDRHGVDSFFVFCQQKNLNYLLPSVLKYYSEIIERDRQRQTLLIDSAYELSKAVIDKIRLSIDADAGVAIDNRIDPSLLGGFIAQYENRTYDASLKNQLARLKNKLINNS